MKSSMQQHAKSSRRVLDCLSDFKSRPHVLPIMTLALLCVSSLLACKVEAQTTQTPWQNLTSSQLTAVWWEWLFGIPVSSSPWFDDTGAIAATSQPYFRAPGGDGSLFFLIGTITVEQLQNGDVLGQVTRQISIKQGTGLFFPLINTEWDNICSQPHLGGNCFANPSFPQVLGIPQLRALAAANVDAVTISHATLAAANASFTPTGTAVNLTIARLQSPPFAYTVPLTDNIYDYFGIPGIRGTVAPAISDGLWSSVAGTNLAPGNYVLKFGGSFPINSQGNTFTEDITYNITVTP